MKTSTTAPTTTPTIASAMYKLSGEPLVCDAGPLDCNAMAYSTIAIVFLRLPNEKRESSSGVAFGNALWGQVAGLFRLRIASSSDTHPSGAFPTMTDVSSILSAFRPYLALGAVVIAIVTWGRSLTDKPGRIESNQLAHVEQYCEETRTTTGEPVATLAGSAPIDTRDL